MREFYVNVVFLYLLLFHAQLFCGFIGKRQNWPEESCLRVDAVDSACHSSQQGRWEQQ